MAITYFKGLLDPFYSATDLSRPTIEEARRGLRTILGYNTVPSDPSSYRSILGQALESLRLSIDRGLESVEGYYNSQVVLLQALKSDLDSTQPSDPLYTEKRNAFIIAIREFTSGFAGSVNSQVTSLTGQITGIVETSGFIPSEWSRKVGEDVAEIAGETVVRFIPEAFLTIVDVAIGGTIDTLIDLITLDNYVALWDYISTGFMNDFRADSWTTYVTAPISFLINTVSFVAGGVLNNFLLQPVVNLVSRFFNIFELYADPDTYLPSSVAAQLAAGARESILSDGLFGAAYQLTEGFVSGLLDGVGEIFSPLVDEVRRWSWVQGIENAAEDAFSFVSSFISSNEVRIALDAVSELLGTIFPDYRDGVSESRYGLRMERSWLGSQNSFLNNLQSVGVNFLSTTPLDPSDIGSSNYSLYGNMMLGAPLTYTRVSDPNNRVMINTFVKDSTFLSLTPGLPKYNGGFFQQEVAQQIGSGFTGTSTYLNQTESPQQMVDYLLKNGLDADFARKDKRYYTFEANYEQYFAYLETMLNALWVKMGLGTAEDGTLNIFSFFNPANSATDYDSTLRDKYRSSIGFFVNPEGAVQENLSNQTITSDLANAANTRSDEFQRLNYITGMGTGGDARNVMRQIGIAGMQMDTLRDVVRGNFSTGGQPLLSIGGIGNLAASVIRFSNTQDMSSLVQQFQVTNGMKVIYPDLWTSSNYTKSTSFSFNFVSPYGDPLSIFQYVYVPFFSLLAFAMPRQAAENGLVTPFLVRADMPGIITSDLAMITQIDWVKGGPQGLFTKDKLPRAISGQFVVQDLYPYLAATKRLSFLSANPSFTVFLDNMAGLRAIYSSEDDPYRDYWRKLVNRVSGQEETSGLWNVFGQDKRSENDKFARGYSKQSLTRTINKKAAPWLSKV